MEVYFNKCEVLQTYGIVSSYRNDCKSQSWNYGDLQTKSRNFDETEIILFKNLKLEKVKKYFRR